MQPIHRTATVMCRKIGYESNVAYQPYGPSTDRPSLHSVDKLFRFHFKHLVLSLSRIEQWSGVPDNYPGKLDCHYQNGNGKYVAPPMSFSLQISGPRFMADAILAFELKSTIRILPRNRCPLISRILRHRIKLLIKKLLDILPFLIPSSLPLITGKCEQSREMSWSFAGDCRLVDNHNRVT